MVLVLRCVEAQNPLIGTRPVSWFLQMSVRKKKCVFAVMFEEEQLLTLGCRTTCLRKNIVGGEAAKARNADTGS